MKAILIDLKLKGRGIVNFDQASQRHIFNKSKFEQLKYYKDNVKYSKKEFYSDVDGNLHDFKIKISSACLNKGIYSDDMIGENTNFINSMESLFSIIGSPIMLLKGFLYTVKDNLSYKRKSPIRLTDAIQTNDAYPVIEIMTNSGHKNKDSEESGITLFAEESVGDITYSTEGYINLNELQFISLDDYYDRWTFSPDDFGLFEKYIKGHIPSFNSKPAYYLLNNSKNTFPELGIRLSNEDVDFLVKYYLRRVLKMRIERKKSYVEVDSLRIKFVNDGLIDTMGNPNGWITIERIEDIDNLNIECDEKYVPCDDQEEAKKLREYFFKSIEEDKKKKDKKKKVSVDVDVTDATKVV